MTSKMSPIELHFKLIRAIYRTSPLIPEVLGLVVNILDGAILLCFLTLNIMTRLMRSINPAVLVCCFLHFSVCGYRPHVVSAFPLTFKIHCFVAFLLAIVVLV